MRPNIVWILCDELRADAMGSYSTGGVPPRTPALDALAQSGTRFDRAYCNSPVCVPSRTSMLTATLPEQNGVYHNEAAWRSFRASRDLLTFPEHFAQHGYVTATVGKSHASRNLHPWQHEKTAGSEMGFHKGIEGVDLDLLLTPGIRSPIAGRFPADRPYPPEQVTTNAIDFLKQDHEQPFLLRVSYLQPHTPVLPPEPFASMFDDVEWPDNDAGDATPSAFERRMGEVIDGRSMSTRERARAKAAYYGMVAWVDAQVAAVMAAIRARGDADRTIVVFNSDHGAALGEGGRYAKQVFAPEVQRVPTLYSWPGQIEQGAVRQDLAQNMDMARTLCSLCGIAPDAQFGGRDLFGGEPEQRIYSTLGFGLEQSSAFPNREAGRWGDGSGWPRRACVRTEQFRLDMNVRRNGRPVGESEEDVFLADCHADPGERINQAGNIAFAAVRDALRADLLERARNAVEPLEVPDFSAAQVGGFKVAE